MVGRRGISKGCMRCRQRKKGCDLQRPACGQCLHRGSTCPGYGQGATFIHESRSVVSGKKPSLGSQTGTPSLVATPPSLIRSVAQAGLSDHFWHIYLPRKYASPGSHHGSLDDIFQAVEHLSIDDMGSKHAFWALSSLVIGREVSDPRLTLQGSSMYGKALKEMRATIEDERKLSSASSAAIAMTCNLLALYEIFDDPSQTRAGFYAHSQGLSELVWLWGSNSFRSGVAWAAFQGVRVAIILSAMQRRKATFLSSREWCTIPWEFHFKTPWQKVIDITAQVPELLEDFDQVQHISSNADRQSRSVQLLDLCLSTDRALRAWYQELPSLFGMESSAELWYTKQSSHTNSPFPIEVYFEDQIHAQALILYWATCVLVYSTVENLNRGLRPTTDSASGPTFASPDDTATWTHTDPYCYAARIVQSMPYFLQPSVGLLMRQIYAFPLATAYAYFASASARSSTTTHSTASWPHTLTAMGQDELNDSARQMGPSTAPEAETADADVVRTHLESQSKTMQMHGFQLNMLCGPPFLDNSLSMEIQSGLETANTGSAFST